MEYRSLTLDDFLSRFQLLRPADSQEEAEYQETFDKVNKILRQLEK